MNTTRWGCWSELTVDAAAATHVGRRDNNEDAYLLDTDRGVFAVADGMGGYHGGEVASAVVVGSIERFVARNAADGDATWPWGLEPGRSFVQNLIAVAIRIANQQVMARRKGVLAQMGSTVVAVALDGHDAVLAHVGDSRIYRLRDGELDALTRDHSLIEELRATGQMEHPANLGHIITRAIGFSPNTRPDLRVERVEAGDVLLLCSDGLSDPLGDDAIARGLSCKSAEAACTELVAAAYEAGGTDNITALVLRFGER
ncbi:MAG: serine/threonine-protein phosphatase [Sandaracinaceae bacterium]|nr:serine/threonine-protein phosphatase [Sandaracinaceae bacterium]